MPQKLTAVGAKLSVTAEPRVNMMLQVPASFYGRMIAEKPTGISRNAYMLSLITHGFLHSHHDIAEEEAALDAGAPVT